MVDLVALKERGIYGTANALEQEEHASVSIPHESIIHTCIANTEICH